MQIQLLLLLRWDIQCAIFRKADIFVLYFDRNLAATFIRRENNVTQDLQINSSTNVPVLRSVHT